MSSDAVGELEDRRGRRAWLLALPLAAVVAAGLIAATSNGLDVDQRDNPVYMSSAESLKAGDGYTMPFGDPGKPIDFESSTSPVIDFPFGYPAALAGGLFFGGGIDDVTRWLAVVLVSVTTALLAIHAVQERLPTLWAGVAAAVGGALVFAYGMAAQSEPIYLLLLVLTLWCSVLYLRRGSGWFITIAALLASLSVLVRSIGVALVATVVIAAVMGKGSRRSRYTAGLLALLVGLVPVVVLAFSGAGREMLWHPPGLGSVKIFLNTVAGWFVPPVAGPTIRVVLFGAAVIAGFLWWRMGEKGTDRADGDRSWLPGVSSAVMHLLVLVGSMFLFDAQNELTRRLMLPVALSLLVAGIAMATRDAPAGSRSGRGTRVLAAAAVAALLANGWVAVVAASDIAGGDRRFNSPEFLSSEVVEMAAKTGSSTRIFSNIPDGLWYAGAPGAYALPTVVDPITDLRSDRLSDEVETIRRLVEEENALILYERRTRPYMLGENEVLQLAPCVLVDDGARALLSGRENPNCP